MKVYVAGPMSGMPDNNRRAFATAEQRLALAGHEPVNPYHFATAELHATAAAMGRDFTQTSEYADLIDRCLYEMNWCEGICMLDGWEQSNGASTEYSKAKQLGLTIGDLDYWAPSLKWIGDPACAPVRKYSGDAGWDLFVAQDTIIPYRGFADVPLGIAVELPRGVWAMLTGRSSTIRNKGILVTQGVIDNGYRGDLYAGCQSLNGRQSVVRRGERIAQLIPFNLLAPTMAIEQVDTLSESDRGVAGFGSTGT
jgi:dUTP pyrophosphatase